MAERDLVVRFIGDDRHLQQAFTRSERRAGQFDSRMTKLNQSLRGGLTGLSASSSLLFGSSAFIGTAALVSGIEQSVDAASDLNEQISKSRQVFGESSREIEKWSATTAEALGISQREALAAAGTFGNLFSVIDLAPTTAANMSRALVQLAADLASFNNASPEDVLTALRSGLIGEAEPLRRFGVLLSEARVQQVALAATGKENIKTLTDQEKALARYSIILEDTAKAQGDFARTSDGLANQSRILRANIDDLSASIGGVLLDDFGRAAKGANTLIGAFQGLGDAIGGLGGEDFSEANASFDELVRRAEDFANVDFTAPQLEALVPRIVAIGEELNRLGRSDRIVAAFREASEAIDRALEDGVITPLEKAQLEADALGRIFLQIAPEGVLQGLAADVRSGIEDATAAARVGVEDLGAEIRSGIEDASRQAAIAARQGGETVGDSFVQGLQAASVRIEGQLAGLGEQVTRAQIAGDEAAEREALQRQKERLENLLRKQEQIVASGGAGAATARKKIREDILPQLLAVSNAIERGLEEQDRAMEEAERDADEQSRRNKERLRRIAQKQAEEAREARENIRRARQGRQFEALGLTSEGDERTPGVGALRRRLRSLREQVKGTTLDTEQTQRQLEGIKRVLSGKFGEVGKEVRESILRMFNDISGALEQGGQQSGRQITPGGIRPLQRLIAGANLTEAQIARLEANMRRRRSGRPVNAFGFDMDSPAFSFGGGTAGALVPDVFVTVEIDGTDVTGKVVRKIQKTGRKRANRRGGANAGRTAGI